MKSCIRHLPLAGQWQGQCIRLWRMHRRRLGFAISLKRMANEMCLYNSMLIGSGVRPPSGGREGEKGKGGRAEGTCPGGPLRAAHPLPSLLLPPLGPRNPTGNPSLCFFSSSSFYFFGSTCHQLCDCCLSTFYFLLSLSHVSLCNVLLLNKLLSARILKCSVIQGKSF